jgi:hypothetical protein
MVVFFGVLVVIHGLITLAISSTALSGAPAGPQFASLPGAGWYPVALGDSWLLRGDLARIGGVLWLVAGVGMLATAASIFGIVVPTAMWRALGLASASVGLVAIVLFFHPYYTIAVVVNLALIAAATAFDETSRGVLGV